jgi:hypothetical protein
MVNQEVALSRDAALENDVCRAIRPKGDHIHVVVKNGDVNLSGDAPDFDTKKNIFSTVENFPGVGYVVNHIRVLPNREVQIPWDLKGPEAEAFRKFLLE